MDGSRFDSLTRSLVTTRSRRSLAHILGGAVLGLLGRGTAAARCKRHSAPCVFDSECCSGNCHAWDGKSGNRCPKTSFCACLGNGDRGRQCDKAADCKTYGREDWKCDNGYCVFKCGTGRCLAGQVCLNRGGGLQCWQRCKTEGGECLLAAGGWFITGQCARGVCYPIPYIGKACHYYGPACKGGAICTADPGKWGICKCRQGENVCGAGTAARCRNLNTDTANCGTCGTKCTAGTQICRNGRCCTPDGSTCPAGCGPGGRCGRCCSGVCRLDGTCGTVTGTECLATLQDCPSGCTASEACPGCCDGTCNRDGKCSPGGCVFYGELCDDSTPCCNDVTCLGPQAGGDRRCRWD
jgi:hypothetical protein